MTTTDTSIEIGELRSRIIQALSRGESVAGLEVRLKDARAAEVARSEVDALRERAEEIRILRERAAKTVTDAEKQGARIDRFLAARDEVVAALGPALTLAEALPQLQEAAQEHWSHVPVELTEYLPPGFTFPAIEGRDGVQDTANRAGQALVYLRWTGGLLGSLVRSDAAVGQSESAGGTAPADTDLPPTDDPNPAGAAEGGQSSCSVCASPQRDDIDAALRAGKTLRSVAESRGVSKSTLGRHRAHVREG